jgi:hypothetical protein
MSLVGMMAAPSVVLSADSLAVCWADLEESRLGAKEVEKMVHSSDHSSVRQSVGRLAGLLGE